METLLKELRAEFGTHESFEFEITHRDGRVMFLSNRLDQQRLSGGSDSYTQPTSSSRWLSGLGEYRILRKELDSRHGPLMLLVGIPLTPWREAQRMLLSTLCLVVPLMLVTAMAGGYWVARRALAPIDHITRMAERITAERLDQRLDVPEVRDELSRLANTFNDMIDRLHRSFNEMRRFTADAAHELRTPLTVLRTQLEVALRAERTPEQYRDVLVSLHEDTVRLCLLASQLLELSREDAGVEATPFATVRLDDVLRDVLDQVRPAAELKSLRIETESLPETEVAGDAQRLRRVFVNVLDNAVKHTPAEGRVCLNLSRSNGCVAVSISDTGCGIPAEHVPHIFDRFYRADPARTSSDGFGLGLAICQAIVHTHHGRLELRSTPGHGTTVTVTLPSKA